MSNPPEYRFYEKQPFRDDTGIPPGLDRRCTVNGCRGIQRPVRGTQHFDAGGGGMVDTKCDTGPHESAAYWQWTKNPPAENAPYHNRTSG